MTLPRTPMKCLTIVVESLIEQRVVDDLRACGARGWTITPSRGVGPSNRRVSELEGGNSRIDVLVDTPVCERIWELLEREYFPNYAVTAWLSDVEVARPERYAHDNVGSVGDR
jgi:nitrogen regulatory protein P-II 2